MRKVLRARGVDEYWGRRWDEAGADRPAFESLDIYPVKYVDPHVRPGARILEAGCGLGRVVAHYHFRGAWIAGFDYIAAAVAKIKREYPALRVHVGDIRAVPYRSGAFDLVTCLGLFHSIESLEAVRAGLREAMRCLRPGGIIVASVRADNLENRLIDRITEGREGPGDKFHKWCFTEGEFRAFLEEAGACVEKVELITNVPFLHKFGFLRASRADGPARAGEAQKRSGGYRLNLLGRGLYALLRASLPGAFGTTLVFTATK